ncbi:MAG: Endo,4-beta-xylanase precursor [Bacteroidota bacterium]|jgi:predicted alpha/beta superfamily hydrolase
MKRTFSLCLLIAALATPAKPQGLLPQVASGKIERVDNFQSQHTTARNIDIWLPAGYSGAKKYAVLYMHDGQMLYDPAQSWNKQAWDIDEVASELFANGMAREFIVVGIWNGGPTRHQEYFPQAPFEAMTQAERDTVIAQLQDAGRTKASFQPQSDGYLQFIVKELKPYIDQRYSVNAGPEGTFMAGSSMGGLISLYAICEYPEVFGGVACLSTHWPGTFTLENNPVPNALIEYLGKKLPSPENRRIYFDCGDQTLDALYPAIQARVDDLMQRKGYAPGNWTTRYFPGEDHSEKSWNKRLQVPIGFLLGK